MFSHGFITSFMINYISRLITERDRLVFPVLCQLARILKEANLKPNNQEQLLNKLGFVNEEKEEIKRFSSSRMYMIMLLKWENKFGSVGVTKKLAKVFRECDLWEAANLIAYEYTPHSSPPQETQTTEA